MKKNEFIAQLEQDVVFVEEGTLTEETVLNDLEDWDSMAVVAVIALVDSALGVQLSGEQISSSKTVGDLLVLVSDKLEA